MARIRLKHVNAIRNRRCKNPTELRYYFRRGGKNFRLPGQPGSDEFQAAYAAALAATSNTSEIGADRTAAISSMLRPDSICSKMRSASAWL
jgi:hypothetical protein